MAERPYFPEKKYNPLGGRERLSFARERARQTTEPKIGAGNLPDFVDRVNEQNRREAESLRNAARLTPVKDTTIATPASGTLASTAVIAEPPKKPAPDVPIPRQPDPDKPVRKSALRRKIAYVVGGAIALLAPIIGVGAYVFTHRGSADGQTSSDSAERLNTFSGNPAPVQHLEKIPPGRENLQENLAPAIIEGKLPEITPYIQQVKSPGKEETSLIPFPSVFNFRLKEEPPITQNIKVFTPAHPEGTMIENATPRLPNIYMQGYVLAKEQSPDGSVLIALGIPKDENKLFSNEDLDKPGITQIDDKVNNNGISNLIIWVAIQDFFADSQKPLKPSFGWSLPETNGIRSILNETTDPKEIFKYIREGDPVYAGGYNPPYENDKFIDLLDENYKKRKGNITYEEAKREYLDLGNQNLGTIQRVLEDIAKGNVSLRKQLDEKRYIIQARSFNFVVSN